MSERHLGMRRGRLLVAASALAMLVPAGGASAAVGTDSFSSPPALLFSVSGSVTDTFPYTAVNDPEASTGQGAPANPPPECPTMFHTAWWSITGTGEQISLTTAGSTFDTILAVYDPGSVGGFPLSGNRRACDRDSGPGTTSALTFSTVRGRYYLIQVGGRLSSEFGSISLAASAAVRPGNDDRIAPLALQTGIEAVVDNRGASQELGETLRCATNDYAATMWFRWTAPAIGDAVFSSAAAFDTAVSVTRASDGAVVGCDVASARPVAVRVSAGDYIVQVGSKGPDGPALPTGPIATKASFTLDPDVDGDGALLSGDCNDNNPAIRPGVVDIPEDGIDQNCDSVDAINFDRDGDSYVRPNDCNDNNPKIHPGQRDIPGNKVDEDCLDGPAPYPRLDSAFATSVDYGPVRIVRITIRRAVAGSRVELVCRGRGCFKPSRKVIPVRKSRALLSVLSRDIRKARLKRRAILEIRVTKPGHVGVMRRITVRRATQRVKTDDFCLPVGTRKARVC